jgi:HSP20 family molecular chaperone IbpA
MNLVERYAVVPGCRRLESAADVVQRDDDIVVKASIPGVKAKDIDVASRQCSDHQAEKNPIHR